MPWSDVQSPVCLSSTTEGRGNKIISLLCNQTHRKVAEPWWGDKNSPHSLSGNEELLGAGVMLQLHFPVSTFSHPPWCSQHIPGGLWRMPSPVAGQ